MNISRSTIDFKGGKVTDDTLYITNFDDPNSYIDQDVLLVEYANNFFVDVTFHDSSNDLSVYVISGIDWDNPIYTKSIGRHDKIGLIASIKEAVDIAVKGK
ncbi:MULTISPECIES: hypothetical protein [Serratia]|jgi:hypothetical protein|uniref:hypothetical protein n=1 Tax=Serratia TaxID=613 RepID=UPI000BFCDF83|nr:MULTISPECIES: hypothetical protein [Serratia]ATM75660.1 hypothetical protein CRN79_07310 [Serratia fonticola]